MPSIKRSFSICSIENMETNSLFKQNRKDRSTAHNQNVSQEKMIASTDGQLTITDISTPCLDDSHISNPELINGGLTRDFLTLACYNAIAKGQIELLKAVYKTGKAPQVDKQGNTPLHIAARCGQLSSLRWLLQYSSTPIHAKNSRGETPLHVAGLHGHLNCLEALVLTEGDNLITILCERDNMGMTVLHHATIGNRDTTVSWLAEQFGKDLCLVKSVDGVLSIHLAAAAGNTFCTQVLAEVCLQTINIRDMFGATAAFYAAQEGHLPCLEYLVEEAGSKLGLVACEGMTAVLTAAEGGHLDVLKYILHKQGSSALLESTNDGATVFHYCSGNGHYQILKYILEMPDTSDLLRLCDTNDRSPAHDAADNGYVDCLRLIIDAGMSIYQPDKDGETPLSLALKSGNPDCAMYAKAVSETTMDKNTFKQMKKMMGSKFSQISNIITIQALSESDAKSFKNGKPTEWNGAIPESLLQKKKMVGNMDTVENECLSLKSEGIYVWPSWQRSLTSRRTNRPANRGIFRGEFILLRSSPPGTVAMKNRNMAPLNRNGHLYAQRNRPCPISLPLQKHEYPTLINQMDGEDEFNTDDIERMFKQPLDVIPEYGHTNHRPTLYQVEEESEDSSHDLDDHDLSHENLPYTINTLDKHGLKEAQTSFSVFAKRPYRRIGPFSSSTLIEDYSSDESGISTESGISSHSDNDDKTGYNASSSDESGTSKSFSDSNDSAVKDSYCMSSDEEDIKIIKRKKSELAAERIELDIERQLPSQHENLVTIDTFPLSEDQEFSNHSKPSIKVSAKSVKTGKRLLRNVPRKRNGTVSSSDEEGFVTISSSFLCMNRKKTTQALYDSSDTEKQIEKPIPSLIRHEILQKPIQTESLASVLKKSMMGKANLKNTLRNNSMKDNTCKTVFNSASLTRDGRKKTPVRQERDSKTAIPRKCSLIRSERSLEYPNVINQQQRIEHMIDSGSYSSTDDQQKTHCVTQSESDYVDKSESEATISRLHGSCENDSDGNIQPTQIVMHSQSVCGSDEDVNIPHKTAAKIKALQDVLMKQSLPFSNPLLLKGIKIGSTDGQAPPDNEVKDVYKEPSETSDTCLPVPPPPPPPPATLPKSKKPSQHIVKCVSYATTTKVQTERDDCQLDEATKTRIASIKSMLERASNIEESCSTIKDKNTSSDTT